MKIAIEGIPLKNAMPRILDAVNNFSCGSSISGLQCEMQEAAHRLVCQR